jgi:F-type H+-transporting ATPase subunit b
MENLGLNVHSFIINTLVFGVFFVLMHFLVLKKLGGILAQREAKLMEADKRAEATKHALVQAQEEFATIIANAKLEAQTIVAQSKHQASAQTKALLAQAQTDAESIIAKAQGVLAVERAKMLAQFNATLETAIKEALTTVLAAQASKIDFDPQVLQEVPPQL